MNNNSQPYYSYIGRVNLRNFLEKNELFSELSEGNVIDTCFFCNKNIVGPYIRLNNGKLLCKDCAEELKYIRYPEKYQKALEEYLLKREARKLAYEDFISKLDVIKKIEKIRDSQIYPGVLIFISIFLMLSCATSGTGSAGWYKFLFFSIIINTVIFVRMEKATSKLEKEKENKIKEWNRINKEPEKPEIKEFYDPTAELTERDKKILEIFDYWPGYPPYWRYLRDKVLQRDNYSCQITGCPSRTNLQIHHKIPIYKGGSHRIDNLITLCEFHHALVPEKGHTRILSEIITDFFTMVRAHYRQGHYVNAHVRRKHLADRSDIARIISNFGLSCPKCGSRDLKYDINEGRNKVYVWCNGCYYRIEIDQKLPEEIGPIITSMFNVNKNKREWDYNDIKNFNTIKYREVDKNKKITNSPKKNSDNYSLICPRCGSKLVKKYGKFGYFYGCSAFPRCRYTRSIKK